VPPWAVCYERVLVQMICCGHVLFILRLDPVAGSVSECEAKANADWASTAHSCFGFSASTKISGLDPFLGMNVADVITNVLLIMVWHPSNEVTMAERRKCVGTMTAGLPCKNWPIKGRGGLRNPRGPSPAGEGPVIPSWMV
jgi:hypothetical protein